MSNPNPLHDGLFYIDRVECVACGACQAVAPDLIEVVNDHTGTYQFKRQPETPAEIDRAVAAINGCCVACIYYRGQDPTIVRKISDCAIPGAPTMHSCHAHPQPESLGGRTFRTIPRTARLLLMTIGQIIFYMACVFLIFAPHITGPEFITAILGGFAGMATFLYAKALT